ncbi:hypothetical protein VTO42DRAFT_2509 [Malbranchea cinnamomea]
MAHSRRRPSLPRQFANFTNRTAGLDLTLRMIQALAMIAAEVLVDKATVVRCETATVQLALARRYLRFFSFIDCFGSAFDILAGNPTSEASWLTTLKLTESSCLGLYLFMENFTMLHDMNLWLVPWYKPVLLEANKFWFYAICASLARTVGQLWFGSAMAERNQTENANGHSEKDQKKEGPVKTSTAVAQPPLPSNTSLLMRIVADSCDLTLPTSFLGWVPLGNLGVGMAMVVSTIITSRDIWVEAQH